MITIIVFASGWISSILGMMHGHELLGLIGNIGIYATLAWNKSWLEEADEVSVAWLLRSVDGTDGRRSRQC